MSGTHAGGIKARDANLAKDPNFYRKVGAKGGAVKRPKTRYFTTHRDIASSAGRIGGYISRRTGVPNSPKFMVADPLVDQPIEIQRSLMDRLKDIF